MAEQIACYFCRTMHKARSDKWPLVIYGDRKIIDKKTKQMTGRQRVIIGYVCKKCKAKYRKQAKKG